MEHRMPAFQFYRNRLRSTSPEIDTVQVMRTLAMRTLGGGMIIRMMRRQLLLVIAVAVFGLTPRSSANSQEAPHQTPLFLDQVIFASSKDWFLVDNLPTTRPASKDAIQFRRFYLYVKYGKMIMENGIANALFVICQNKYDDVVVFHIPSGVELKSMRRDQWISKMNIRVLADDVGSSFEAEYIKGDLFIDITPRTRDALMRIIESRRISIELGPQRERLEIYQADMMPDGKGDLRGFTRDVVPMFVNSLGGRNIRVIKGAQLLDACARFKTTGVPPRGEPLPQPQGPAGR
jgi:hypothetical protein